MADKDDKNDDNNKALTEALGQLNKTISGIPENVQKSVATGIAAAFKESGILQQNSSSKKKEEEQEEEVKPLNEDELEKMSRADFARHMGDNIAKSVMSQVTKAMKPLTERMAENEDAGERERLKTQIKEAREKYKDFDEFRKEIVASVEEYPNLSIEDHYKLVKADNPEKVKEIEEKIAKEKEEEEKKAGTNKPAFGGLTPTSGEKAEETQHKTTKDAAEAAWEDTMSEIPTEMLG